MPEWFDVRRSRKRRRSKAPVTRSTTAAATAAAAAAAKNTKPDAPLCSEEACRRHSEREKEASVAESAKKPSRRRTAPKARPVPKKKTSELVVTSKPRSDSQSSSAKKPKTRQTKDVVAFVRTKLDALDREQMELPALQHRVAELETQLESLTLRHQLHQRCEVEEQIAKLKDRTQQLETKDDLRKFRRDARHTIRSMFVLETEEKKEERLAAEIAAQAPATEEAPEEKTKVKKVLMRRRQVAKPEVHVISGQRLGSCVVADEFLERNNGGKKPLCTQSEERCAECGGALVMDVQANVMVCEACCYEMASSIPGSSTLGYAHAESVNLSSCRYRRSVHFRSHLDRYSGSVGSEKITDELIDEVIEWLHSKNIPLKKVTTARVEVALKKLGHSKMANHKTVITSAITGKESPFFTPDKLGQLMTMFHDVSRAYDVVKATKFLNRVNFISYQYCLYQQLQLLNWATEEHQRSFRLLKGRENLAKQDIIWKAICEEAGFKFISSV
jgi:TolA-binding protein